MREHLDCAIVKLPVQAHWLEPWIERTTSNKFTFMDLNIPHTKHANDQNLGNGDLPNPSVITQMSMPLCRYDLLVLPVCPKNLVWCRILLNNIAKTKLVKLPVFAISHQVEPIVMYDFMCLGMQGFASTSSSTEELRVRLLICHLSMTKRPLCTQTIAGKRKFTLVHKSKGVPLCVDTDDEFKLSETKPQDSQFLDVRRGRASDGRNHPNCYSRAVPEVSQQLSQSRLSALSHPLSSSWNGLSDSATQINFNAAELQGSFKQAKAHVVAQFEQCYLTNALARSHGNIAKASRLAQKNRRAFWALMQKYRLKAKDFRDGF